MHIRQKIGTNFDLIMDFLIQKYYIYFIILLYIIFFDKKMLKYLNDFQNWNFSVLWLKWTQTTELKQNQTFFHGAYSNLTSYLFSQKILKYFNDFFTTKENPNNRNETKSDIFLWDLIKSDIIFYRSKNTKIFQ